MGSLPFHLLLNSSWLDFQLYIHPAKQGGIIRGGVRWGSSCWQPLKALESAFAFCPISRIDGH